MPASHQISRDPEREAQIVQDHPAASIRPAFFGQR
jgi:hypothetical protein